MKNKTLFLIAIFTLCCVFANAENKTPNSADELKYLFVITGDKGTYNDGKLTIIGVPIVSFNYLGTKREVGHFLVGKFVTTWEKNSAIYKAAPPSATISVLDENGSIGAVIQLSKPTSTLNSLTFDAKVLEGQVPDSFNASSIFLELNVEEKLQTQN